MSDGTGVSRRGRWLTPEEIIHLKFGLTLGRPPREVKRTLQALCSYYEGGRALADAAEVRQLVHSYLSSPEILLRRWALKALGLIGSRDDTHRIVDRLRVEPDAEAQTWGTAALLKSADDRGLDEVCAEAGLERTTALVLAARLYAPKAWLEKHPEQPKISLNDDELTLKWAIFLAGYNKAPKELFDPKHSNAVFLGELNKHPSSDISEYSAWALWERPDYDVSYLTIPLDEIHKYPESVRKWLFRLMTQSAKKAGIDSDVLDALSRDPSPSAREGLALGVADLDGAHFAETVLEWFGREDDPSVRENLIASMARRSRDSADYAGTAIDQYAKATPDSPARKRLLAASVATPIYQKLRDIEQRSGMRRVMELFGESAPLGGASPIIVLGDVDMSSETTFNAGRDINAHTLAGRDIVDSANAAVQQLHSNRAADHDVLAQVLEFLKEAKLPESSAAEIAAAVKAAADNPAVENKRNLLDLLTGIAKTVAATGGAAAGAAKIVALVHGWAA